MSRTEKRLEIKAEKDSFPAVMTFLEEQLEAAGCPMATLNRIAIAAEEIFVNVASYAYTSEDQKKGIDTVTVSCSLDDEAHEVDITFIDHGVPFNPLAREDPDIAAPAEERQIGGLGIFMVKKMMDDVTYAYTDGQNILSIRKSWAE